MADNYIAEIRAFPTDRIPSGWLPCEGQLLDLHDYTALFALFGATYGGDGARTFALPDLRGSVPMHYGSGPGLSRRELGEPAGVASVELLPSEIPSHTHTLSASARPSDSPNPGGLAPGVGNAIYAPAQGATLAPMNAQALARTGQGAGHNNLQPYMGLCFCIAFDGEFPPRP